MSENSKLQEACSSLKQKYQEAIEDKMLLSCEIKDLQGTIKELSEKIKLITNLKKKYNSPVIDPSNEVQSETPVDFVLKEKDLLEHLMEELENLLNCPILLIPIQNPVILPSGHTVEKVVMQNFIEKQSYDPYDNSKIWEHLTHNRFFSCLKELYESINNKMNKARKVEVHPIIHDYTKQIEFLEYDTEESTEDNQEDTINTKENGIQWNMINSLVKDLADLETVKTLNKDLILSLQFQNDEWIFYQNEIDSLYSSINTYQEKWECLTRELDEFKFQKVEQDKQFEDMLLQQQQKIDNRNSLLHDIKNSKTRLKSEINLYKYKLNKINLKQNHVQKKKIEKGCIIF